MTNREHRKYRELPAQQQVMADLTWNPLTIGNHEFPVRVVASHEFDKRGHPLQRNIPDADAVATVVQALRAICSDFIALRGQVLSMSSQERVEDAQQRRHDLIFVVQCLPNINIIGVFRWDEMREDGYICLLQTIVCRVCQQFHYQDVDTLYTVKYDVSKQRIPDW